MTWLQPLLRTELGVWPGLAPSSRMPALVYYTLLKVSREVIFKGSGRQEPMDCGNPIQGAQRSYPENQWTHWQLLAPAFHLIKGLFLFHLCTSLLSLEESEERVISRHGGEVLAVGGSGLEIWLLGFQSPGHASPTMCLGVSDLLYLSFLISKMGEWQNPPKRHCVDQRKMLGKCLHLQWLVPNGHTCTHLYPWCGLEWFH